MAILVVCAGCKKRFQVSDKFAGKKGPCPQCKAEITIPAKSEEVVVHTPEQYGPKTRQGAALFKPVAREHANVSPVMWVGIAGGIIAVLAIAFMFRSPDPEAGPPTLILVLGALGLAPPLVWGGYSFLRNRDLEPHKGLGLWTRIGVCSSCYAVLWGVFSLVTVFVFDTDPLETFQLVFLVPPLIAVGALAGFASMDLDFTLAAVHYSFYLGATVLLRLILGLNAFGY